MSILKSIIPSGVRIKILMRLFFNPEQKAYIRGLAEEFHVSPSQVSQELKQLEQGRLLISERIGCQNLYRANTGHPLFPGLKSVVKKALGMERVLEVVLEKLGDLKLALVIDDYAEGRVHLVGLVCDLEGKRMVRREGKCKPRDAANLGILIAEKILEAGGLEILEEVYREAE